MLYFRILFLNNDLNLIKEYVQRQLVKILSYQKINIFDFVFSREVRFGSYKYEEYNRLPLAAVAAKKQLLRDPSINMSYGQRVPFVIISKPFSKLYEQAIDLSDFLENEK
jgi:hypothetical protein